MIEVLAGEIMLLEETDFGVQGFAILPNHAHAILHLPKGSNLSFAKVFGLLHLRTGGSLPPPNAAQTAARGRILASKLV